MSAMPHAHRKCHRQIVLPAMRVESRGGGQANAAVFAPAAGARDAVRRAADRLDFHRPCRSSRSCRAWPRRDCSGDSRGPGGKGKNPDRGVRTRSGETVVTSPFRERAASSGAPDGNVAGPYDEMSRNRWIVNPGRCPGLASGDAFSAERFRFPCLNFGKLTLQIVPIPLCPCIPETTLSARRSDRRDPCLPRSQPGTSRWLAGFLARVAAPSHSCSLREDHSDPERLSFLRR